MGCARFGSTPIRSAQQPARSTTTSGATCALVPQGSSAGRANYATPRPGRCTCARDYSPSTGRFTSRDPLIPNAPGTQGYNPYWYANDNPATLADPAGTFAGAATVPCDSCTPVSLAALAPFVAGQAALAASAARDLQSFASRHKWTIAAFGLVAALFVCLLSPLCREGVSDVTGGTIEQIERIKQDVNEVLGATVVVLATVATTIVRVRVRDREDRGCTFSYPYHAGNFPRNLACLTEGTDRKPIGFDAHHVFPKEFEREFNRVLPEGIHYPRYGQWWLFVFNRGLSGTYNRYWKAFFADHSITNPPTYAETLNEGRWIMAQFRLSVLY